MLISKIFSEYTIKSRYGFFSSGDAFVTEETEEIAEHISYEHTVENAMAKRHRGSTFDCGISESALRCMRGKPVEGAAAL